MNAAVAFLALFLVACSSEAPTTTAEIGPEGGVVRAPNGVELEVPAGALSTVTSITLEDLSASDAIGVRFQPDGLEFASPATLRIPVPASWAPEGLRRLDFAGSDADDAVEELLPPVVNDGVATIPVEHFSGIFCARNCHAGTIRQILSTLEQRGCSREQVLDHVRERFPEIVIQDDSCGGRSPHAVQAVLDSLFVDQIGYDDGEPIGPQGTDDLIATAAQGKMVAILFKRDQFGARDTSGFYSGVAHSAVLEEVGGEWQLRNSVATVSQRLIDALDGNTVWYPADQLDEFRQSPSGIAAELQVCGEPGCLSAPELNPMGHDLYLPVAQRPKPWTAMRVFIEDPAKVAAIGCGDDPSVDEYPRTYGGVGTMSRTVAIDFDDMSSASCDADGEWTATLAADGTVTLGGTVDMRTQHSPTAICVDEPELFRWTGSYDSNSESFSVTVPYEGQDFELVGSYGLETLTVSGFMLERTARIAGFGERNVTWTESLNLTLQRQ